jgi:phosphoglycolate phosphatase
MPSATAPAFRPRAVLFDLDGTLLDTLDDLADSANAALAHHGFPVHPVDAYKYFVGDGVAQLMLRILPGDRRDTQTAADLSLTYRDEYRRRWKSKSRPYPGIAELLDALASRNIPSVVLSNKPDDFTRACVTELLPRWTFDVVMGASDTIPHKPNPAGALQVARMVKVDPADFLYLGDTSTDMKTAVAAGMYPVGALWGFRTRDELLASGAKVLADHPRDVVNLLS